MNEVITGVDFKDCPVFCQPGSLYTECTFENVTLVHYANSEIVTIRDSKFTGGCKMVEFLDYLEQECLNGTNIDV